MSYSDMWLIWASVSSALLIGYKWGYTACDADYKDGVRAEATKTMFCPKCNCPVEATSNKPHHLFHGIATAVTAGAWLPIWGGVTAWKWNNAWYCKACHSLTVEKA